MRPAARLRRGVSSLISCGGTATVVDAVRFAASSKSKRVPESMPARATHMNSEGHRLGAIGRCRARITKFEWFRQGGIVE